MNPGFVLFDAIWSYYSYPELVLAKYFYRPDENLRQFDEVTTQKKSTLFAGTDAHSNIGFHLLATMRAIKSLTLKLTARNDFSRDEKSRFARKDKPLTTEKLLQSLKDGRVFIGLDVLSDTKGFSFAAENGAELRKRWATKFH
jgi:hypothetical protein